MKKLYTFVMMMLLAAVGMKAAAEAALTVTVEVNDPSLAIVQYYYYPGGSDLDNQVLTFEGNKAVVEYPDGTYSSMRMLYITPVTPEDSEQIYFKSYTIYDSEDVELSSKTLNSATRKSITLPETADGGRVEIEMGTLSNAYMNVTIEGDPAKINMAFNGRKVTNLVEGEQQVEFNASENYLYIKPVGIKQFYEMTYNGQVVEARSESTEAGDIFYSYLISNPADGDNLIIITDYPEGTFPVKIITNDNPDFVKEVTVDGEKVENWQDRQIQVKAGAEIVVQGDTYYYMVNKLLVNGEEMYNTPSISAIVDADLAIEYDVTLIERNESFVAYVGANCEASLRSANEVSYLELESGYNPCVKFNADDTPFTLYIDVTGDTENCDRYVFVNDELKSSQAASYRLIPEPGDVVKVYFAESKPQLYQVNYEFVGLEAEPTIIKDYYTVVAEDHMALPGTLIEIEAGDADVVTVNGDAVEMAGNSCQIVINGDSAIKIANVNSISAIAADQLAGDCKVYNLQGIIVNEEGSTGNLPAGIYIQGGKKLIVK